MNNPIASSYEQLHQTIDDLLCRFSAYVLTPHANQELAAISSAHAMLKPMLSGMGEETFMQLISMRSKLLTLMENVLYTV